jgi:uncharacterized membrane protein
MNNTGRQAGNSMKETTRLEAVSDGVFAIAITLLVLELIQILHPQNGEHLISFYLHHWEPFLAFLIGFLTILVCWINHHHVFTYIKRSDSNLPWVNGFILLMVTFTPFPTAALAEYLGKEGNYAIAFFGFNYFMISVGSYLICAYPYRKHLIDHSDRDIFNCIKLTYGVSILYTLVAFFVCFISVPLAIVLYILLFLAFAFPKELAMRMYKWRQSRHVKAIIHRKK